MNSFLCSKHTFDRFDRRAISHILRFGSYNLIFFELYVNLQVIVREKFISYVKIKLEQSDRCAFSYVTPFQFYNK